MRYYLISENWLISPTARRVYRWCAAISLLLLPSYFLFFLLARLGMLTPLTENLLRLLLIVSVAATAVIWVAMEYFLFVIDESSGWAEIFWFLLMILIGIGPALYVFFGYSRAECFRGEKKTITTGKR